MHRGLNRRGFLKTCTLLPAAGLPSSAPWLDSRQNAATPNIIIVLFDTLSAMNMSLYGYPRATTPEIERFAARSTVFHRHYAAGNFTSPGTASLLTGTFPWTHRCMHLYGTPVEKFRSQNIFTPFDDGRYRRIAYSHNDHAGILLHEFGADLEQLTKTKELALFFEKQLTESLYYGDHNTALMGERELIRGLSNKIPANLFLSVLHRVWRTKLKSDLNERYADAFPRGVPSTNASPLLFLLEDGIDWILDQLIRNTDPMFGYFHFFPPHEPYNTRREFVDVFKDDWKPVEKPEHRFSHGLKQATLNERRRLYDEYIRYADAEFGRLINLMGQQGLLENTYVILTSDHGEMFERGIIEHVTQTLFEPIIRIPLVVYRPGQGSRIDVRTPSSCIDLLPTLARITGRSIPNWSEGYVLPTFGNTSPPDGRSIYALEAKQNPKQAPLGKVTLALIKGDYKLIGYFGYGEEDPQFELYDVVRDPEELEDMYSPSSSLSMELRETMLGDLTHADRDWSQ